MSSDETESLLVFYNQFHRVWRLLASGGHCDEVGGAEYRRVFREWCQSHEDVFIGEFIADHANLSPKTEQDAAQDA